MTEKIIIPPSKVGRGQIITDKSGNKIMTGKVARLNDIDLKAAGLENVGDKDIIVVSTQPVTDVVKGLPPEQQPTQAETALQTSLPLGVRELPTEQAVNVLKANFQKAQQSNAVAVEFSESGKRVPIPAQVSIPQTQPAETTLSEGFKQLSPQEILAGTTINRPGRMEGFSEPELRALKDIKEGRVIGQSIIGLPLTLRDVGAARSLLSSEAPAFIGAKLIGKPTDEIIAKTIARDIIAVENKEAPIDSAYRIATDVVDSPVGNIGSLIASGGAIAAGVKVLGAIGERVAATSLGRAGYKAAEVFARPAVQKGIQTVVVGGIGGMGAIEAGSALARGKPEEALGRLVILPGEIGAAGAGQKIAFEKRLPQPTSLELGSIKQDFSNFPKTINAAAPKEPEINLFKGTGYHIVRETPIKEFSLTTKTITRHEADIAGSHEIFAKPEIKPIQEDLSYLDIEKMIGRRADRPLEAKRPQNIKEVTIIRPRASMDIEKGGPTVFSEQFTIRTLKTGKEKVYITSEKPPLKEEGVVSLSGLEGRTGGTRMNRGLQTTTRINQVYLSDRFAAKTPKQPSFSDLEEGRTPFSGRVAREGGDSSVVAALQKTYQKQSAQQAKMLRRVAYGQKPVKARVAPTIQRVSMRVRSGVLPSSQIAIPQIKQASMSSTQNPLSTNRFSSPQATRSQINPPDQALRLLERQVIDPKIKIPGPQILEPPFKDTLRLLERQVIDPKIKIPGPQILEPPFKFPKLKPPKPPRVPPMGGLLDAGGSNRVGRRREIGTKRRFKYAPSLAGITSGRSQKKAPSMLTVLTGFEIRPVVK